MLVVDHRADHVRWEQIGRELDSLELRRDGVADRVDRQRLREAGDAFEKDVSSGEKSDEDPVDHHILADHDLVDLVKNLIDESALALNHFVDGTNVVRHVSP